MDGSAARLAGRSAALQADQARVSSRLRAGRRHMATASGGYGVLGVEESLQFPTRQSGAPCAVMGVRRRWPSSSALTPTVDISRDLGRQRRPPGMTAECGGNMQVWLCGEFLSAQRGYPEASVPRLLGVSASIFRIPKTRRFALPTERTPIWNGVIHTEQSGNTANPSSWSSIALWRKHVQV